MKKVIDLNVSKRPMVQFDSGDQAKLVLAIDKAKAEASAIDAKLAEYKASAPYLKAVLDSRKRMIDIACAVMELDPADVKAISRAQGSYFERKRLTEEMLVLEEAKKDKVSFVEQLKKQLQRLTERIMKGKQ